MAQMYPNYSKFNGKIEINIPRNKPYALVFVIVFTSYILSMNFNVIFFLNHTSLQTVYIINRHLLI